jgi:hypothetical protein
LEFPNGIGVALAEDQAAIVVAWFDIMLLYKNIFVASLDLMLGLWSCG